MGALNPIVGLTVLSALAGVAMLWVFRKTSDQVRLRAVKRKVHAYLLEMRVFADEPGMIWRTQKSLMAANLRYMGLALRPALWLAVPMVLLYLFLQGSYGHEPLAVGRDVTVTASLAGPVELIPPPGVVVTAPPVRIPDRREVSWRIRASAPVAGVLRFRGNGKEITQSIRLGGASLSLFGWHINWLLWFLAVSMVSALLLRKRMGVTL